MDKQEAIGEILALKDEIESCMKMIDAINSTIQNPNLDMARIALHDANLSLEEATKNINNHKGE